MMNAAKWNKVKRDYGGGGRPGSSDDARPGAQSNAASSSEPSAH